MYHNHYNRRIVKNPEQLEGLLFDQEGAVLELTVKLFPALHLPSSPFVPPPITVGKLPLSLNC